MKFNINETVRVRLTDYGRAVLREDWHSTTNIYYARPEQRAIRGEYKPPKEDEHGWSEWQLWALMQAFGEHTFHGCRGCFETEIEISSADLIAAQGYRAAAEEIATRRGEMVDALIAERDAFEAESFALRAEISRVRLVELCAVTAERDALAAEVAALKADPLAEMWAALADYQPQADRDGHGKSWKRMCSERTKEAAWNAVWDARSAWRSGAAALTSAGDAAFAASNAADQSGFMQSAIDAIRRAKEGQR